MRHGGRTGLVGLGAALSALALPVAAPATVIPESTKLNAGVMNISFDSICLYTPTDLAIPKGTEVIWSGSTVTCPLVFDESIGIERIGNPSNVHGIFLEAGKYPYHSETRPTRGGTIYAIGARARLKADPFQVYSADPVAVALDAAASDSVDYLPDATKPTEGIPTITDYAFDFGNDGVFDQTGTATSAQYVVPGPGTYQARLHVTDNQNRTDDDVVTIEVKKPIPFAPPLDRSGNQDSTASGTTKKGRVVVTVKRRIKVKIVRRKGIVVKVRVPNVSDKVRATLSLGKRKLGSRSSAGNGSSLTRTLRLKLNRKGKRIVKPRKSRRLRVTVVVTDLAGEQITVKRSVRARR